MPQLQQGDEIILVDDASLDKTPELAKKLGFTLVQLHNNSGVGKARNEGARAAKNEILAFFDDDILPNEDYLQKIREIFEDQSMQCCQGLHDLEPANNSPSFSQTIEAFIWHHCMGTLSAQKNGCHSVFSQSFVICKSLFFEVGGFSENFKGAGGEEFELAARLFSKTTIHLKKELRTRHVFQSFYPRLKTLYKRAQNFKKIYNDMEPEWKQSHVSEILRSGLSLLFIPLLLASVWDERFLWSLPLPFLFFVVADALFALNLIKWGKVLWIPLALFQRYVQYFWISCGLIRGML